MFVEPIQIAKVLGGAPMLGTEVRTEFQLAEAVRAGFPFQVVGAMNAMYSVEELDEIVPKSTRSRRRMEGRFSPEESDRLERAARAYASTVAVLKSPEKAKAWLRRPNRAMEGHRPIDLLRSDAGLRLVETVLGRIEYGVFS